MGNVLDYGIGVGAESEFLRKRESESKVRVGISKKVGFGAESALPRTQESESELKFLFGSSD